MNIGDSRVTHEPPDAERHVRVVWEEGSRKAPSYPIPLVHPLLQPLYQTPSSPVFPAALPGVRHVGEANGGCWDELTAR